MCNETNILLRKTNATTQSSCQWAAKRTFLFVYFIVTSPYMWRYLLTFKDNNVIFALPRPFLHLKSASITASWRGRRRMFVQCKKKSANKWSSPGEGHLRGNQTCWWDFGRITLSRYDVQNNLWADQGTCWPVGCHSRDSSSRLLIFMQCAAPPKIN